ncbi:MAG: phosphomannomutase/phosphoglucomutase [Deferribacterales bacterium]
MLLNKEIFRSYDIRGVYGDHLTESLAESVSYVFAVRVFEETGKNNIRISLGRDIRFSSSDLHRGAVRGLLKAGADVVDLGECPSPLTYFSMYSADTDGYLMITGSHNPPQFNGLKVGTKNTVYHTDKIERIYTDIVTDLKSPKTEPGSLSEYDVISDYKAYMTDHFSGLKNSIKKLGRPLRIVIDCGSGTASGIAPDIFTALGADVLPLYCVPDGSFPGHHPDPTVEKNMREAKDLLIRKSADMAVGYDGDADRVGALDDKGQMIWGDELLCVLAGSIAEKHKGATVVADVKASKGLYEYISSIGMNPVMYRSGHSMIKVRMKELKAVLGGEMSAHIFFADRYFGFDDGIYASLRLVEAYVEGLLSGRFSVSSDMTAGIPKYVSTPEIREPFPDDKKFEVPEKLKNVFADYKKYGIISVTDIDGVRVEFEKGWALVRASNTEPLLVTRYEAENENELTRIRSLITTELDKLK